MSICQCVSMTPEMAEGEVTCCLCKEVGNGARKERELCRSCWRRVLHRRRFDLVAMNLEKKSLFILEFKRTSDLDPRYREEALARAEQQYTDEIEGLRQVLPEDWKVIPVHIIAGSTSVNEVAWNAAMKALGVPAKKWKAFREHLMHTLLNELDKILRSFWTLRRVRLTAIWCLLCVLIRQGLGWGGGSGPQRWIARGKETGNPMIVQSRWEIRGEVCVWSVCERGLLLVRWMN